MGTPEFAVAPLKAIADSSKYEIPIVVTAPDKPAGRGRQIQEPAVKTFAKSRNIPVLQPEKLKDPGFLNRLSAVSPDLIVVVAFRMLPRELWSLPSLGTFNLHASLLPQYRGAAPIQHAIMNGETGTGLTTFFIDENIDTGNILFSQKIKILPSDNAGTLHDRMMDAGASLVLKTIDAIFEGTASPVPQELYLPGQQLKMAPKITKEDCKIEWSSEAIKIHNKIRGLSPHPGAYTTLVSPLGRAELIKIFDSVVLPEKSNDEPGKIAESNKSNLIVATGTNNLRILELQLASKKRMKVASFLAGANLSPGAYMK